MLRSDVESGESTPLVETDDGLKEMQAESLKEKVVTGISGVGLLTSILSLLLEKHPMVIISSVFGLVFSPYAAFQQRKITETEALKQTNEQMATEVDHLRSENDKLESSIKTLESTVSQLQELEQTLDVVQNMQGDAVTELERQLEENRTILATMHQNKKGMILQNLITVLFASDADSDMILNDQEIDDLIRNLEGIHGVQLKEGLLRHLILEHGRNVGAIMEVARNVLTGEDGHKQLFTYVADSSE